jgi:hypothetical protein
MAVGGQRGRILTGWDSIDVAERVELQESGLCHAATRPTSRHERIGLEAKLGKKTTMHVRCVRQKPFLRTLRHAQELQALHICSLLALPVADRKVISKQRKRSKHQARFSECCDG